MLRLTLWHFSRRHRSILSLEEEVTPFQQLNGLKLFYKLPLSTQIILPLATSITFGSCVFPSLLQLVSVVSGQLPPVLPLLLRTLHPPVPSGRSPPSETSPKCGILLLVGDCSHLQDCSTRIAVGSAKCTLAKGRRAHQSQPGTHLHRAGTFGHAANPLPQPQATYCGMVAERSLADSAQPGYFLLN